MEKYIVYTEIINRNGLERWYYGTYDHERANEVTIDLGSSYDHEERESVAHCVCKACEAEAFGVLNLPASVFE